ncbi:Slc22a18 [Symbiodinium natans]|uniref:Histone-lysine N-methyltransferase, H3 lysine-79 specific n=1 Tax=Symbiodinium natans TaxID=878477 RepID=A0A812HPP7_9DINO|nr:Slc22a18 [Symbiodinium natans]
MGSMCGRRRSGDAPTSFSPQVLHHDVQVPLVKPDEAVSSCGQTTVEEEDMEPNHDAEQKCGSNRSNLQVPLSLLSRAYAGTGFGDDAADWEGYLAVENANGFTNSALYGEVNEQDFAELLGEYLQPPACVYDLGSGTGKLVNLAALLGFQATGVELEPGRHQRACIAAKAMLRAQADVGLQGLQPLQPRFLLMSFLDFDFSDADLVWANSVVFSPAMMEAVAAQARRMRPGALVISHKLLPGPGFEPCGDAFLRVSWRPEGKVCFKVQRVLQEQRLLCNGRERKDDRETLAAAGVGAKTKLMLMLVPGYAMPAPPVPVASSEVQASAPVSETAEAENAADAQEPVVLEGVLPGADEALPGSVLIRQGSNRYRIRVPQGLNKVTFGEIADYLAAQMLPPGIPPSELRLISKGKTASRDDVLGDRDSTKEISILLLFREGFHLATEGARWMQEQAQELTEALGFERRCGASLVRDVS